MAGYKIPWDYYLHYRYRPNWLTSFWTQLMCLEMGLALPTITFHLRRSVRDKPTSRCKTTLWMLTILSYKPVIPGVAFIWQINKKVIKITFQSWILSQNHSVNDISLSFQVHNSYSSFVHPWLLLLRLSPQLNSFGCATDTTNCRKIKPTYAKYSQWIPPTKLTSWYRICTLIFTRKLQRVFLSNNQQHINVSSH